ncbi:MAG: M56 family metallopeptidase [Firmicutes bacterium]|nr:M56 family metallopeptidase [Bacillota bacterium]
MNIFSLSLSATYIILAILVVRTLFIHRLPKKTFMALWSIAACRLLLPFSIPSQLNIGSIVNKLYTAWQNQAALPVETVYAPVINDVAALGAPESLQDTLITGIANIPFDEVTTVTTNAASLSWLFYLWLAGACVLALYFLITHWRCQNTYKISLPIENRFIEEWLQVHPLRRKIHIRQSDNINAPLTYGILKPVILLPGSTDWQDETGLAYVLAHEYVHIQRFDTLYKWILVGILSMHWFNPFVWLMYIFANRDIELTCDEMVVQTFGEKMKSVYALMLISLGEKRGIFMGLCSNFSKNSVEERVVSIMKTKKNSVAKTLVALILISSIVVLFATTKTISAIPLEIQEEYKERMLFVTTGETALKVTYDGNTWEYYPHNTENEDWKWYNTEEFEKLINLAKTDNYSAYRWAGAYEAEKDLSKLEQTLADIKNGIKVSKCKIIFVADDIGPQSVASSTMRCFYWYCFGYVFKDKSGNTVDLGLFETRSALFAALKRYYDKEVMGGRMSQGEADRLFNKIAHPLRNHDEVSLLDKFINVNWSSVVLPTHGEGADRIL